MELANLSVLLVWGAATALAIGFIAFAVDLSRLSGAKVDARDAARSREKVAVGAGVRHWREGDRVTLPFVCGCGQCAECRLGQTCTHCNLSWAYYLQNERTA